MRCGFASRLSLIDEEDSVREILEKLQVDVEALLKDLLSEIIRLPEFFCWRTASQMYLSPEIVSVLESATKKALEDQNEFVSPEYLFYGILTTKNSAREVLNKYSIDKEKFLQSLRNYLGDDKITDEFQETKEDVLEKYTQDLTKLAEEEN